MVEYSSDNDKDNEFARLSDRFIQQHQRIFFEIRYFEDLS
ncbi:hypothetical protein SAMN03080601_02909 [Alkalitalea saponilacus]|uniref:Uncharacterized protein n=1 Tax=Alkalitalea saponilacus TaxID=889453 RepID=A0A1T5HSY2_9BACT|nr:hypothetical protein SAMN03080601_02909 [Alkalitalea saponilacus]